MIRVSLLGSTGRMGTQVLELLHSNEYPELHAAESVSSKTALNSKLFQSTDVWIDFSRPQALLRFLKEMPASDTPIVTGSTGWSSKEWDELLQYTREHPIFFASNFSVGIHILRSIIKENAQLLSQHGFTVSVSETHHVHKVDKPSGTARSLIEDLRTGYAATAIAVESIREGEVIGDHTLSFKSTYEELSFSHHASDRRLFAAGALHVAQWIARAGLKRGRLYSMDDFVEAQGA